MLPSTTATPEATLVARERQAYLRDAIEALPERLQVVVSGCFFEDRPMRELADELGVTESRISQMRAEALKLLRDGMAVRLHPSSSPSRPTPAERSRAARHGLPRKSLPVLPIETASPCRLLQRRAVRATRRSDRLDRTSHRESSSDGEASQLKRCGQAPNLRTSAPLPAPCSPHGAPPTSCQGSCLSRIGVTSACDQQA